MVGPKPVPRTGDAPRGGGITTQRDSFAELEAMSADAVGGYFEPKQRPKRIRLHFSQDPILAVAESASLHFRLFSCKVMP
jgi:hypothetical protein